MIEVGGAVADDGEGGPAVCVGDEVPIAGCEADGARLCKVADWDGAEVAGGADARGPADVAGAPDWSDGVGGTAGAAGPAGASAAGAESSALDGAADAGADEGDRPALSDVLAARGVPRPAPNTRTLNATATTATAATVSRSRPTRDE